jgi:hypothetical protein
MSAASGEHGARYRASVATQRELATATALSMLNPIIARNEIWHTIATAYRVIAPSIKHFVKRFTASRRFLSAGN